MENHVTVAEPGASATAPGGVSVETSPVGLQGPPQGTYYSQGYYPTVSYAAAQPLGGSQVIGAYQYVMPQAGFVQPSYGWAYYPAGVQQDGTSQLLPISGLAIAPAKDDNSLSESEQKALRRKQANRESARRSKIRKKAESESLEKRAEELEEEYSLLSAEIHRHKGMLEELRAANSGLRTQLHAKGVALQDMPPVEAGSLQTAAGHRADEQGASAPAAQPAA
mmetsp:Transcript_15935/g.37756  ORF Transcript_15935/g.37756 Transcript_15935/m.37756 type:complete len:223 (-) Transcript_15935:543-1211(-)